MLWETSLMTTDKLLLKLCTDSVQEQIMTGTDLSLIAEENEEGSGSFKEDPRDEKWSDCHG